MEGFFDLNNYDKICDDVYSLGTTMVLRFNVMLNKYTDNGRENYHKEFEFYSGKSRSNVRSIRRSFDYYISIENTRSTDQQVKDYMIIRPQHMFKLNRVLEMGLLFFSSPEYSEMYKLKDSHLVMTMHPTPLLLDLGYDKKVNIEPIVYSNSYSNNEEQGVRLYLNGDTNYTEMNLDRYVGFYYLISKMDMYGVACNMINYMQRGVGDNVISYSNNRSSNTSSIEPKNNRSYSNSKGKTGRQPAYLTNKKDKLDG